MMSKSISYFHEMMSKEVLIFHEMMGIDISNFHEMAGKSCKGTRKTPSDCRRE